MRTRIFAALLLCSLLWPYSYMRPQWGYNQASRLDVLHAVFSEKTIAIDSFHENTGDKIEWNGHFYSEKAPGVVVIAAPAFAAIYAVLGALSIDSSSALGWKISEWFTTVFSVGLLSALSALFLFQLLKKYTSSRTALISIFAVYLGTLIYTYAVMLFSHSATASLLIIALWAIDNGVGLLDAGKLSTRHSLLAGGCLGLAIACEYTSALSAGALVLFVLYKNRKHAEYLLCGSVLPLLLIPLNNWLISGSVLSIPYAYVTEFPGMKTGLFGIELSPNVSVIWQLLGSQYRGLFFWSPFLLLCIPGCISVWQKSRSAFWLMLMTPLISLVLISSYSYWHGGWALGPRHLAAVLPFLCVPAALGCQRYAKTGVGLAALSVILTGIATVLQPLAPEGQKKLIIDFYMPMLQTGEVRESLGTLFGLHGILSLLPLCIISAVLIRLTWKLSVPEQ